MISNRLVEIVCQRVSDKLNEIDGFLIPVGVSNKHIHLSQKDLDILFGVGYKLNIKKNLGQPGQFAAEETVTIRGNKGEFEKVRILGPVRTRTQLEISKTDSFLLGIKPPIRESGDLKGSCGVEIIGPKGKIRIDEGTIVALRHIHMTPEDAIKMNVKDGDFVDVKIFGKRKAIVSNVLIRVSDKYKLEMHIDTDEANALGLSNNDKVLISHFFDEII
ncbi:phosphate propanoyltransferase [Anaerococcus sp. AGMB09787]|uniref:phosphate propanoyltransferase n=1 Tax=Anaerococcus sp. AGMB09787 TaxID=2922869 RepID=UPI001FB01C4A|nr:phosphate propanoyltransferase [Anaerococcus sp. AGMB09787]